jgi:hypothetical protein
MYTLPSHIISFSGAQAAVSRIYESCRRTKEDEEFLLVRLQVIWLLIGAFALISVRRQKRMNATLFDQRKIASQQVKQKLDRPSSLPGHIEMVSREETQPLTTSVDGSSSLEVV